MQLFKLFANAGGLFQLKLNADLNSKYLYIGSCTVCIVIVTATCLLNSTLFHYLFYA